MPQRDWKLHVRKHVSSWLPIWPGHSLLPRYYSSRPPRMSWWHGAECWVLVGPTLAFLLRINAALLTKIVLVTKLMPALFRLRNDLYCVEWGVKLYSLTHPFFSNLVRFPKSRHFSTNATPAIIHTQTLCFSSNCYNKLTHNNNYYWYFLAHEQALNIKVKK